jgi:hypothetical protein
MLNNDVNLASDAASQTRVSTRDLTEALASLDARKARQDFDQVGTVTLTDAIQECSIEATPEELQAEIDAMRDADAAQEKAHSRQRRLRLALKSELVSAALCLLVVLGLKHTLLNKTWQQNYQAKAFQQQQIHQTEDFQDKLRQSTGPNPEYDIYVVPESSRINTDSQTLITTTGGWANSPVYPLYALPDGYNIHIGNAFYGLNDEGHESNPMMPSFMSPMTVYVEFREHRAPYSGDHVSVFYDGLQYWRGAIRKQDIPSLLQSRSVVIYPIFPGNPQQQVAGLVPLTISMQSIQASHGQWGQAYPRDYTDMLLRFSDGNHVDLDKHAWEQYSGSPDK